MKKNYKKIQQDEETPVKEPGAIYEHRLSDTGITQMITRTELESECFSLQESKDRMIEKIHRHFHPV